MRRLRSTSAEAAAQLVAADALLIEAGNKDYTRLLHRISTVLIEVDGDTATIRAHITAVSGHADSLVPVDRRYGLVRTKAVRTPDGWRISELNVESVFAVGQ